jgi:succinoglycan biosynthesis transport protein ExoP
MNSFDIGTLLYEMRRFWWLLCFAVAGAMAFGYWQHISKPKIFESEAKMVLSGKINIEAGSTFNDQSQDFLGTQATIMQGHEVHVRTEKALADSGKLAPGRPVELSATYIPRTTIFLLKATGTDPDYTQKFLDEGMRTFIALRKQIRLQHSDVTETALTEELTRIQNEIAGTSQELNEFQRQFSVVSLEDETTAETEYLTTIRKRLADLRLQKSIAATGGTATDPATAGASIPIDSTEGNNGGGTSQQQPQDKLLIAKQDLAMLQAERQRLLANLRPQHPKIRQINVKIDNAEKVVSFLSSQIHDNDTDRISAIDREMDALRQEIKQKEDHLFELTSHLAAYRNLKSRLDNSQATYDKLTASMQNVGVGRQLDQEAIAVLESASPPLAEKKSFLIGMIQSSFLGFLLGTGLILVSSKFSQRFQTIDNVKRTLRLPIFGKILRDRWAARLRTVLDCDRNHLEFAESFRNLRSSLLNLPVPYTGKKCIAVTSAVPHEGKSTVAANLAIALSAANARVLLVDGDIRRGRLDKLLNVDADFGLSDLLTNRKSLNQVLYRTRMPTLMLLPSGAAIPNITEQMLRYGVDEMMHTFGQHFDYVILDTPPVLAADDAATLAAKADWTLFVVRLGYSSPLSTQRAIEELTNRQVDVPGIVINSVPRGATGHSYYHYYNQRLETNPFLELMDHNDVPDRQLQPR